MSKRLLLLCLGLLGVATMYFALGRWDGGRVAAHTDTDAASLGPPPSKAAGATASTPGLHEPRHADGDDPPLLSPLSTKRHERQLPKRPPFVGSGRINGVILFLSGGRWDSYFLRECLPRLERYYLKCNPYPVHVFHENLPVAQRGAIQSVVPSALRVDFEDVSSIWQHLPRGVSEKALEAWMQTGLQRKFQGRGYRIMCRFWAGLAWRLPSMQAYEYYWRLDTDSILTEPPRVDPFVVMQQRGCDYGFNRLKGENPHVATQLWDTYTAWAQHVGRRHDGSSSRALPAWYAPVARFAVDPQSKTYWAPMYYNNFELGSMRLKRHPLYDGWFEYVDSREPYGIFRYRWGDAPLHTLGVETVLAAEGWRSCNFTKADVMYRHAAMKPGPIADINCSRSD